MVFIRDVSKMTRHLQQQSWELYGPLMNASDQSCKIFNRLSGRNFISFIINAISFYLITLSFLKPPTHGAARLCRLCNHPSRRR